MTQPGDARNEPASEDRYHAGMAVRRAVLGDAHVDRASAQVTPLDADFQRFITEGAWGSVWSRPGLSRRERSLLTIALLAALGHDDELALHIRATRNTGASPEDIAEAMMHVAVYAGVPAANHALRIAKATLDAMTDAGPSASAR
jgi:4-carboxymuconolactone decarboxylase